MRPGSEITAADRRRVSLYLQRPFITNRLGKMWGDGFSKGRHKRFGDIRFELGRELLNELERFTRLGVAQ